MYSNYDFEKYFDIEENYDILEESPSSFSAYINYLKTYSAYNTLIKEYPEKMIKGDPLEIHQQKCLSKIEKNLNRKIESLNFEVFLRT